jgi:hypothetical protein
MPPSAPRLRAQRPHELLCITHGFCPYFCPNSVSLGGSQWVWVRRQLFNTNNYRGAS